MTIGSIVLLVIGIIVILVGLGVGAYFIHEDEIGYAVILFIIGIIIGAIMIVGPIVYSNTESGKRALKDQNSNFNSGIERVVSVYDVNGKLIEKYEGKFDVETDHDNYILFDDEEGRRHIIFYKTGTVIVDEK